MSTTVPADEQEASATGPARGLVTSRGETTIAPSAVASVAQRAAQEVDGVEVVSSGGLRGWIDTVRPDRATGTRADVASRQTAVELTISVCWPRSVHQVTDAVRAHVRERVRTLTGYEVADVDIVVAELPAPSRPPRVR